MIDLVKALTNYSGKINGVSAKFGGEFAIEIRVVVLGKRFRRLTRRRNGLSNGRRVSSKGYYRSPSRSEVDYVKNKRTPRPLPPAVVC
ncbi:hypothetical protein EVAR_75999_1 [Eumeta japonica]|uniref:Uncharacterized protein n=1 Tax=Eumeta variegata TaxID=151549 RepID=A0A4C1UA48_EUMVA|nr:hypothetical protein EVAR_75999_1 [Eumeta japonica]